MADGCHRCGGICCLQLRVACFPPERRYHHQSTRRHSPEDRKIRIKRFYLFENQTENGIVWDSTNNLKGVAVTMKSQHYRRPPRISFHAQQACFDNNTSRSTGTSRLAASVCRIPSFIITRKHFSPPHKSRKKLDIICPTSC